MELSEDARTKVTLLCFADTLLKSIQEQTQQNSRRFNRLAKARDAVAAVDETFTGYLPPEYQEAAEIMLDEIERRLLELIGRGCNERA